MASVSLSVQPGVQIQDENDEANFLPESTDPTGEGNSGYITVMKVIFLNDMKYLSLSSSQY